MSILSPLFTDIYLNPDSNPVSLLSKLTSSIAPPAFLETFLVGTAEFILYNNSSPCPLTSSIPTCLNILISRFVIPLFGSLLLDISNSLLLIDDLIRLCNILLLMLPRLEP